MREGAGVVEAVCEMRQRTGAVVAAILARDGTVLSADVPPGVSAETFAILCATIFGAAGTLGSELRRGRPQRGFVDGPETTTALLAAGPEAILALTSDRSVPRAEARAHAEGLTRLLRAT